MLLPAPGSPDFTRVLLDALQAHPSLYSWDFDGTLVAVFLLARIVRRGGVIVDVPGGRRHSVIARAARTVTAILESIYGLDTHTLHLGAESTTASVRVGGDAIVVTGLEDAPSPVLVKMRVELRRPGAPFVVWVRDEDRDDAPSWILDLFACSTPIGDFPPPPDHLEPAALIPTEYIDDLRTLLPLSHIHPPLDLHISNLVAAAELHPQLHADISQSGSAALAALVRGQRLLSGSFLLPPDWRASLADWRAPHADPSPSKAGGAGLGLGAASTSVSAPGFSGRPGVATWGARAGEVPSAQAMLGPNAEEWFCTPENVAGAWELAIRHRLRVREHGESALFAQNGTALERTEYARKDKDNEREAPGRTLRDGARRKRVILDDALDQMLATV